MLDKIQQAVRQYRDEVEVIKLSPFDEKQIKQLVESEFSIHNHVCLDRIAHIAQGNPRLAMMAAEIVKREKTLKSINDVSALYDEYFVSVMQDLKDLGDQNLLKVTGLVSFFRVVDQSNEEMMGAIQHAFKVPPNIFWQAAHHLHDLEILDMYENEVVRISDQVLATYLFYLAFFKNRILDFSALLTYFFPSLRQKLIDAVNPVLSAFHSEMIIEVIRSPIDEAWKSIDEAGNEENLFHLMDVFWFLKQTDTLLYIRSQIEKMEQKPINLSNLDLKGNTDVPSPSILGILGHFQYADDNTFRIALNLLYLYIYKHSEDLPQALYLLTDRFCFKHTSYRRKFSVQREVIDVLWEWTKGGEDELYSKLFLTVGEKYLHTYFHVLESKDAQTIRSINFELSLTPELLKRRK